jgi:hypothetical protein
MIISSKSLETLIACCSPQFLKILTLTGRDDTKKIVDSPILHFTNRSALVFEKSIDAKVNWLEKAHLHLASQKRAKQLSDLLNNIQQKPYVDLLMFSDRKTLIKATWKVSLTSRPSSCDVFYVLGIPLVESVMLVLMHVSYSLIQTDSYTHSVRCLVICKFLL